MSDFRGDGRETKAGNSDDRVDGKGERDMKTDRKDSRDHRGTSRGSQVSMVCVNCGKFVQSVYIEYSPGNIRLSNCANCEGIVDKYVEYEMMIVIMDVILHKYEAYRHVFFNYPRLKQLNLQGLVWKATLCSLLLDTWRWANPGDENVKVIEWDSLTRFFITAGKVVIQVGCLNSAYLFVIIVTLHTLSKTKYHFESTYQDVFLAILFSSHFKFFVFAMMVWEFSFLMGLMVDLLMLASNIVALEVMLNANRLHAATAVISGAVFKCLVVVLFRYFSYSFWWPEIYRCSM